MPKCSSFNTISDITPSPTVSSSPPRAMSPIKPCQKMQSDPVLALIFLYVPGYSCIFLYCNYIHSCMAYSCIFLCIRSYSDVNCSFVIISSLVVFDIHHLHYHFDFLWLRLKAVDDLEYGQLLEFLET